MYKQMIEVNIEHREPQGEQHIMTSTTDEYSDTAMTSTEVEHSKQESALPPASVDCLLHHTR